MPSQQPSTTSENRRSAVGPSQSYLSRLDDESDDEFTTTPIKILGPDGAQLDHILRTRLLRFENLVNDLDLCGFECGDFTRLPVEVMANVAGCLQEPEYVKCRDLQALACTNKHFYVFKDYYASWRMAHQLSQKEFVLWLAFMQKDIAKQTSSRMLLNAAAVNTWRARAAGKKVNSWRVTLFDVKMLERSATKEKDINRETAEDESSAAAKCDGARARSRHGASHGKAKKTGGQFSLKDADRGDDMEPENMTALLKDLDRDVAESPYLQNN